MPYADLPGAVVATPPATSTLWQKLAYVAACAVAGAVLGVPAGWVWLQVADPPSAALTSTGAYFGELERNQQVEVTLWFFVVGVALGLVAGLVVGWFGHRHGLATVAAVLALCAAAAWVSEWIGADVFGPDEQAQLADARVGSQITLKVRLGTGIAYLGWPIGGLLGALATIFGWPRQRQFLTRTPTSSSVITHRVQ